YLPLLFESIKTQSLSPHAFEILLVDNNSPGNTKDLFDQLVLENSNLCAFYFLEKNQGLSYARNRAISEARAPLITFLDDDAFIEGNYLKTLVESFDKHPACFAIGGPIHLHYEALIPRWENRYLNSLLGYFDKGKHAFFFKKDYPRGSNMAFRTEVFDRVGEFNVALGRIGKQMLGGEEKDLFNRIYKAKLPVLYLPEALVYHCVPLARTEATFIKQQALGTGMSERVRSLREGKFSFTKRIFWEAITWCASLVLWVYFILCLKPQKGNMIVFFRYWVTRGLLFKYEGA
ncbi:MAG: glycosyltransferase, partial [Flavobacteriales bacterium]